MTLFKILGYNISQVQQWNLVKYDQFSLYVSMVYVSTDV